MSPYDAKVSSPDSVESRLTALERQVAQLREQHALIASDASAARTLAAGADRDVSEVRAELRAHTQVLTSLRETQLEQGQVLAEHTQVLAEHTQVLAEQSQVLAEQSQVLAEQGQTMRAGFASVHAGMEQIVALLDRVTGLDAD